MIILCLSWIQCSGQGTVTLSEKTARKVLVDLAELDMRRVDARFDSAAIVELTAAYFYKDSALQASRNEAVLLSMDVKDAGAMYGLKDQDLQRANKEVRKQKRLKWLCLIGMAGLGILAAVP